MMIVKKISSYLLIVLMVLNSGPVEANPWIRSGHKFSKCKIGRKGKDLYQSFLNKDYIKSCPSSFKEQGEKHFVDTSTFYGNLSTFMDKYIKGNSDISAKQTVEMLDKALRYELLTMNEEAICENGYGKVKEHSLPLCMKNLKIDKLSQTGGSHYLKTSDLIGRCTKPATKLDKNSKAVKNIIGFEKLSRAKKKKLEEEFSLIFSHIRDAQNLLRHGGDGGKLKYIFQGNSAEYIRRKLRKGSARDFNTFDRALKAIDKLKKMDPNFMIGADLSRMRFPVLNVAVAHMASVKDRDAKLDEDYLEYKEKNYYSSDLREGKRTFKHAYQNPRPIGDLRGSGLAGVGMLRNNPPAGTSGLIYQGAVNDNRQRNLKYIKDELMSSVEILGENGVHIRSKQKRTESSKQLEKMCRDCQHKMKCRKEMYHANQGLYPLCPRTRGNTECQNGFEHKLKSCGFDRVKDIRVAPKGPNTSEGRLAGPRPNFGAKQDNLDPFKSSDKDIFTTMRENFNPKVFFSDLRKASKSNMIAGMNEVCDQKNVPFESLFSNFGLIGRMARRNPSLAPTLGCFMDKIKEEKDKRKAWRERWGAISSMGCMAVGLGSGVAISLMSEGMATGYATAAASAIDLTCEAFFGLQDYSSLVQANADQKDQKMCESLPSFMRAVNNRGCSVTSAVLRRYEKESANSWKGINRTLSVLGTGLGTFGLVGALKHLKDARKVAVAKQLSSAADDAYMAARRAGKSEDAATEAARLAVETRVANLNEFEGYPDWFVSNLLKCK